MKSFINSDKQDRLLDKIDRLEEEYKDSTSEIKEEISKTIANTIS